MGATAARDAAVVTVRAGLTLTRLTDIAQAAKNVAAGSDVWRFRDPRFETDRDQVIDLVRQRVEAKKGAGDVPSRGKVWSRLHRLDKFGAFENAETQTDGVKPISFEDLVQPGAVSVIDLTRMTSTVLRNVVIAQILTGVFEREVDPDGLLSEPERLRRAEMARKAHFAKLALKSAQARRKKRERREAAIARHFGER